MPQVCGIQSLFPSDNLYPSDSLAPGSGSIFVPTLPLDPADFPIDDSAAAFVAHDQVISLSRFYAGRFFNDLPEWFQGLPLLQLPGVDPLPEYVNDPDNIETKRWGVQRIVLRAIAREVARVDYILRGRVSLAEYELNHRFPHATPGDDLNVFELQIRADETAYIEAPATFVDPATVLFPEADASTSTVTTGDTTAASPVIDNLVTTLGIDPDQLVSGTGIPVGARVLTVDSPTQVTLDRDATATNVGVSLTFTVLRRQAERAFTNRAPVYAEGSGAAGLRYIFAKRLNDSQTWQLFGVSGGDYTLSLRGETTNPIDWDEPDVAVIQAEVDAFSFVEPGDVVITEVVPGTPGHYRAVWGAGFAGTDVDEFTSDSTNLTGVDPIIDHVTEQDGNSGFALVALLSATPPDGDHLLIGDASWDGTEFLAVDTYVDGVGGIANGHAYYNPFNDPMANNDINSACTPLSQNEGIAPQLFAVTANWALDLWEQTFGLEVPSKNPLNTIQYPERRARLLRAILGTQAYQAAHYSYLAAERARELGIRLGEFEEALYTDPGWDDEDFLVLAQDEVQFYKLNNTTGGTYALSIDEGLNWSGPIPWNASDTAVEAQLILDLGLSVGDIEVSFGIGGRFDVAFGGQFAGVNMPRLYTDATALVGLTPLVNGLSGVAVPATVLVPGAGPSTNELQRITLSNVVDGYLDLDFDGLTTGLIPYALSPDDMKDEFNDLTNVAEDDIAVSGLDGQFYDFEFQGNLAATNVVSILVDTTALVGTPASIGIGLDQVNLNIGDFHRGRNVDSPVLGYQLEGDPAESTYPYYLWATLYAVEGLSEDPTGAASRIATLREYINEMTPAHLQVGFDFGPLGGFIVGISLVGIDRV